VFLLTCAVIAVAAVTSVSGIVNWVGLIVPHLSRRIFGSNAQYSLPGSLLIGAIFTIICDVIARTALTGEIPLGIITSFLGAVIFIVLMSREKLKVGSNE
jgi:iron complex transport system permease protein